jgi:hypothetical protein
MREIEGLSYEEMAQAMGVSKGTIMSRLFHARQKLQRALVDCYEEQVGASAAHARDAGSDEAEAVPAHGGPSAGSAGAGSGDEHRRDATGEGEATDKRTERTEEGGRIK